MAMESLHIRINADELNKIKEEARLLNIKPAEYYRKKLTMDIPNSPKKVATNNDLMEHIYKIEQNVYMCYRLLVSMMLINHGRDASIRNVCDLNEDEVTTLASNFDITVSEILPDFSATKEG